MVAEETSAEHRRADALGLVAESALASGLDPGTRGDRYQVVVHVDAEVLTADGESGSSWLADGTHVSAETSRRLACDSARVVMRHAGDGRVLDVGRRTRAISPGLRRALEHRDGGCRFHGCGRRLCDVHHATPWADGGSTSLANMPASDGKLVEKQVVDRRVGIVRITIEHSPLQMPIESTKSR